jgi:hypothetical protein
MPLPASNFIFFALFRIFIITSVDHVKEKKSIENSWYCIPCELDNVKAVGMS